MARLKPREVSRGTIDGLRAPRPPVAIAHGRASRTSLRRQIEIDRLIREGRCPSAAKLAERFEVDRRTVMRDLEWLRDQMGAPLLFDRSAGRYRYDPPGYSLPALVLTEGELVALMLAERVLEEYAGTPFEADLERAFGKLTRYLPDEVTLDVRAAADGLSVRLPVMRRQDLPVFRTVLAATLERRRLRIRHHTAGRPEPAEREIDPYHALALGGAWYVVGHCHSAGEVRTFSLSRIESAVEIGPDFERPPGFSIQAYLGQSFGIFRSPSGPGRAPHLVRLRFDELASRYIREEVRSTEVSRQKAPGGGLLVTYRLSDLTEVTSWVLSWSGHVQVLAPAELKERVRERLAAAAKMNGWE